MTRRLYIKQVGNKGRGVFCNQVIRQHECIETCPVLIIPGESYGVMSRSHLLNYLFTVDDGEKSTGLVMGFGSLYNHARQSNAAYVLDKENRLMRYYALEDIPPGREICINYAGERGKECREWFDSKGIPYVA